MARLVLASSAQWKKVIPCMVGQKVAVVHCGSVGGTGSDQGKRI